MRESNFQFPTHNRACVCITSTLYDRRALDAPTASLPLVNSLTHLSYLTATSARIREILSSDGGLERLVRILHTCAQPSSAPASLADLKGKGAALPRQARKSPFKAFTEYDLLPSLDELQDLEDADVDGALLALLPGGAENGYSYSIPPSLFLPSSMKARHLLYTYTLAFQCIVNIGVRGSEAIRTRVVEAGALDVVVHVLERYLEEMERKRVRNQLEWNKQEQARLAQMDVAMSGPGEERERDADEQTVIIVDTSSPTTTSPAAPALSRPRLTRINVVAVSSAAADSLAPPSRVQTPDTVVSMDDSSVNGDDNGSSSGQEQDTEEIVASSSAASSAGAPAASRMRASVSSAVKADDGSGETPPPVVASVPTDGDGDVVMEGPPTPAEEPSEAESRGEEDAQREIAPTSRQHPHRLPHPHAQPTPRRPLSPAHPLPQAHVPPPPPSAPNSPAVVDSPADLDGQLQFRDEDVLLALQLLAYLSKYPHVRAVFHAPAPPASSCIDSSSSHTHCHAHASQPIPSSSTAALPRSANVFSLVELFTHRPPSDDLFTPRHSNEVQYWACTIMRNACRKDEQRGGIRQCANMMCGRWEQYAREFAKCRRCRRAKYCSKACQSTSWGNGHKFWCHKTSREEERRSRRGTETGAADGAAEGATLTAAAAPGAPAAERRRRTHAHRRSGADEDEDDEDLEDDLPQPPHPHSTTAPRGGAPQGPTGRHRSGTLPNGSPAPLATATTAGDHPPHAHPARHPRLDALPNLAALEGVVAGVVDPGALPGMPLGIDEDQVAREMMLMGDGEAVRVPGGA
ncbi:hypothetical protein JCM1841_005677 [Sporobolomyces salmonicolor]